MTPDPTRPLEREIDTLNHVPSAAVGVSVAIPTYDRSDVLLDTIRQLLAETPPAAEILILDQTPRHAEEVAARLADLHARGEIRWLRLEEPSQPAALNRGLLEATQPIVLFLDDDIRSVPGLIAAHAACYGDDAVWAVAGSVVQPHQQIVPSASPRRSTGAFGDFDFPFHSDEPVWIANGMSGNLSVRRDQALAVGGFDENFVPPVAYRFDADFCRRIIQGGGRILFAPAARIHHLRAARGGTRMRGSHLTSASPIHGVGDYYYALRHARGLELTAFMLRRPLREVLTRFHLRHPWWVPVKVLGEFRAIVQAIRLAIRGPSLLPSRSREGPGV